MRIRAAVQAEDVLYNSRARIFISAGFDGELDVLQRQVAGRKSQQEA